MVIALLLAERDRHADDHPRFAHAASTPQDDAGLRRRDDNSRTKMQNVRGRSSAATHGVIAITARNTP